jgi:hypothetical protein
MSRFVANETLTAELAGYQFSTPANEVSNIDVRDNTIILAVFAGKLTSRPTESETTKGLFKAPLFLENMKPNGTLSAKTLDTLNRKLKGKVNCTVDRTLEEGAQVLVEARVSYWIGQKLANRTDVGAEPRLSFKAI